MLWIMQGSKVIEKWTINALQYSYPEIIKREGYDSISSYCISDFCEENEYKLH